MATISASRFALLKVDDDIEEDKSSKSKQNNANKSQQQATKKKNRKKKKSEQDKAETDDVRRKFLNCAALSTIHCERSMWFTAFIWQDSGKTFALCHYFGHLWDFSFIV